MRSLRELVFSAADASVDQTSSAILANYLVAVSAQAIQTGAATGALKFQASNDPAIIAGGAQPTNWTDVASQTVTIGAAGTFLIPKFDICYNWIRLVYTKNNGSAGTVTVQINALGF